MILKLTTEQREAIRLAEGPVPIEDEQTHQLYFLVDKATLDSARQQQDIAAIREGLADVEAGRVSPLNESIRRIRESLGLPQRAP